MKAQMRHVYILLLTCAIIILPACSSSRDAVQSDTGADKQVEVGYGSVDKKDVTGFVSTVDVDQARKERPATTVSDMSRGCVSGVLLTEGAGGGVRIRTRGTKSITGSNDPLYVVDGMPVEPDRGGTLSWLNPSDIETVSVFKDASATAICGTRGASGVIVIKTKR
jgi:TonB-dependent SusC/RagA subfamily outer membrane receptor